VQLTLDSSSAKTILDQIWPRDNGMEATNAAPRSVRITRVWNARALDTGGRGTRRNGCAPRGRGSVATTALDSRRPIGCASRACEAPATAAIASETRWGDSTPNTPRHNRLARREWGSRHRARDDASRAWGTPAQLRSARAGRPQPGAPLTYRARARRPFRTCETPVSARSARVWNARARCRAFLRDWRATSDNGRLC